MISFQVDYWEDNTPIPRYNLFFYFLFIFNNFLIIDKSSEKAEQMFTLLNKMDFLLKKEKVLFSILLGTNCWMAWKKSKAYYASSPIK